MAGDRILYVSMAGTRELHSMNADGTDDVIIMTDPLPVAGNRQRNGDLVVSFKDFATATAGWYKTDVLSDTSDEVVHLGPAGVLGLCCWNVAGDKIIISRYSGAPGNPSEVFDVDMAGSETLLFSDPENVSPIQLSLDGTRILLGFGDDLCAADYPSFDNMDVLVSDPDLFYDPPRPSWSPNNRKLLYGLDSPFIYKFVIADADGSNATVVLESASWDEAYSGAAFSPAGNKLVVAMYNESLWPTLMENQLYTCNLDGSGMTMITAFPASPYFDIDDVAWGRPRRTGWRVGSIGFG